MRAGAIPWALPFLVRQRRGGPRIVAMPRRTGDGRLADEWLQLVGECNGVLAPQCRDLPEPLGLYLEAPGACAAALGAAPTLAEALRGLAGRHRVTLASGLASAWTDQPRVGLVVSALHRGGAERVALDLLRELPRHRVEPALFVLGRPQREAYPAPEASVLLYELAGDRGARLRTAVALLTAWGADAIHAHLLGVDEIRLLRGSELPTVVTVHNARPGWPAGYEGAREFADLLVGVSLETTRELRRCGHARVRTIWNGIAPPPPPRAADRARIREQLGIGGGALVTVSVANRRPQKRLELIRPIIAQLCAAGRDAHAIVVGGESPANGATAGNGLDPAEADPRVHWVGPQTDIAAWCSAADVYLCTSQYEGLSLAQLEALALGLPVVSTQVGGAEELGRACARYATVPVDAAPAAFAGAISAAAGATQPASIPQFSSGRMAARHALLYRRALRPRERARGGVLLVANDFAPGGAQASSARLLSAFAAIGVPCAAFVIAEDLENPTAGTMRLRAAGIPVYAAERSRRRDSRRLAEAVVAKADELGVAALAFWNAITELKLRIADLAISIPVFDVSPGETYFTSLERYFGRPSPDLPYLRSEDYGALLKAAVVKYGAEAERARRALGTSVHVIPNGVWPAPQRLSNGASHYTLGTIARISPDKRIDDLVEAFRRAAPRLPACEMLIGGAADVGAEGYAAELARRTADLPIRWLGQVNPRDVLPKLDLFLLVAEPAGCPNASLEAMAAGVPVLATDVGGMREQIEHAVTGWLAPRRDVGAFAELLGAALGDRARLEEIGRRAREHVQRHFSVDRMRDRYRAVFGLG